MGQIGIRWLAFVRAFLLVAVMLTSHAVAEEAESVSRFIELMDDPAVRAFLDQAAQGATPGPTPGAADEARLAAEGAGAALSHRFARWTAGAVALPAEMDVIGNRLSQSIGGFHGQVAGFVVMFCLAGYFAERLFWRVSRSIRLRIVNALRVTAGDRVMFFIARVIVTLISMGMVALGSIGAFFAVSWPEAVRPLLMAYLWVFLTGGFAAMLARFIVAPWFKAIRMVPMGRRSAWMIYRWSIGIPVVAAFGFMSADWVRALGATDPSVALIRDGTTVLVAFLFVAFVWRWRHVSGADAETAARRSIGAELERWFWTAGALGVVALIFAGMPALAITVATIGLVPPIIRIGRQIVRAVIDGRTGTAQDAEPVAPSALASLVERIVRAFIVLAGIALTVDAWGLSPASIVVQDNSASRAMRAAIEVLIALLIADFVWHAARRWIDRRISDAAGDPDEVSRRTRIATLLPLFRKALGALLLVAIGLISLSAIGVEIAPLLGAAGIVGIAVGFGAQTLVRDIVSGIFFLIDDAFRVGEYVEAGNIRGTVEAISLRSMRLRHHRGALHTLPFGEIHSLTNHSRD